VRNHVFSKGGQTKRGKGEKEPVQDFLLKKKRKGGNTMKLVREKRRTARLTNKKPKVGTRGTQKERNQKYTGVVKKKKKNPMPQTNGGNARGTGSKGSSTKNIVKRCKSRCGEPYRRGRTRRTEAQGGGGVIGLPTKCRVKKKKTGGKKLALIRGGF